MHLPRLMRTLNYLASLSLFAVLALPLQLLAEEAAPKALYVKVKDTKVRTEPSQLATVVSSLRYGDSVQPIDDKPADGWFRVKSGAKGVGYLHLSAVTPRKIVLSGNAPSQSEADRSDLVMAGKGFSLEIEKAYAAQNRSLNYSAVNQMERLVVSDSELRAFVKEGQLVLVPTKGGAKS